ncbi:MAG TPA: DoxX family protein [Candidatus Binatia bacterium]|nr:DoxX family protein [Candidatus Binatia bacterium]
MEMVGSLVASRGFFVFARFAVIAFFAIVFLQSSLDKLLDPDGNLAYLRDHFKNAPIGEEAIVPLFWTLALVELITGVLCGLAIVTLSFAAGGFLARWGIRFATFALLALLFGQRLAKDYAGAAVVASYFAVALIGLLTFAIGR